MKYNNEVSEGIEKQSDLPNEVEKSEAKYLPNEVGSSEVHDLPDEVGDKTDVGGEKQYYDDNGKLYSVDNELVVISEYSINGCDYKTDEQSRINSAIGKIQTKNHEGRSPIEESMENTGRGDQKKTDDKGHLIVERSNGGNGLENRIHMDSKLTIKEKQDLADKVAQDYNAKTNPYQRALNKGVEGVKETLNGGVSFAETDNIYFKDDGTKCIVKIQATGNRTKDFDAANKAMDLEETPDGYVWHHIDDYNVEDGTITLELVEDEVHNASKPHSGGCAQYDAVNGPSYNPPRKGDMWNV